MAKSSAICEGAGGLGCLGGPRALAPALEKVLEKGALQMDVQGFPSRLDMFQGHGRKLAQEEGSDGSGPTRFAPTFGRQNQSKTTVGS